MFATLDSFKHWFSLLAWVVKFLIKYLYPFLSLVMSLVTLFSFRALLIIFSHVSSACPLGKVPLILKVIHLVSTIFHSFQMVKPLQSFILLTLPHNLRLAFLHLSNHSCIISC